ncbi:MAG: hypothetical protein ACOC1F_10045 [Myxococcota bacterium]
MQAIAWRSTTSSKDGRDVSGFAVDEGALYWIDGEYVMRMQR